MTKPTSRLIWLPDSRDPLSIWACWRGSGDHYTLEWGDGASQRMLWNDPPAKHTYLTAGAYGLLGSRPIPGGTATARETAVVRMTLEPHASFTLLDDGRTVRAELEEVAAPVRYRLDWGDGTLTEHTEHDLAPEHTYRWGFGAPQITVFDVPARHWAVFTGPEIGPEPDPDRPAAGWFFQYTGKGRNVLLRGVAPPGAQITWHPWWDQVHTDYADADGQVRIPYEVPAPGWAGEDWDTWRSYTVNYQQDGKTVTKFVPCNVKHMIKNVPEVIYEFNRAKTSEFVFSAAPQQLGTYRVDFGDGTVKSFTVDNPPLQAAHTYSGSGPYLVTITLPDGRTTAARRVEPQRPCPPRYNVNYPGQCSLIWYHPGYSCGQRAKDPFTPVIVEASYKRIHQHHCPTDDGYGGQQEGYGYRYANSGWKTFTYWTPFDGPRAHQVNIEQGTKIQPMTPDIFPIKVNDSGDPTPITAWFGDVHEWDGGYSGKFHIANNADAPTGWALEFTLADPAVLREVWPASTRFADLGGGRWRLFSEKPVAAHGETVVGARIEPPGKTKKWPDGITGRPWTTPAEGAQPPAADEEGESV